MGKKKKLASLTPKKDKVMIFSGAFSSFFLLILMIPYVPWRRADANAYMGSRFSRKRFYSILGLTNNYETLVTWSSLRSEVCTEEKNMHTVDVYNAAGSMASALVGGGSAFGCASWDICKAHVTKRCTAYTTMMVVGIMAVLFWLVCIGASIATPIFCYSELSVASDPKKRRKRKKMEPFEYGFNTMVAANIPFILCFFTTLTWYTASEFAFKQLQSNAFYPWPAAHIGCYLSFIPNLGYLVTAYCGVTRIYPVFGTLRKEADSDDEVDQQYLQYGGAPGYNPMLGAGPAVPGAGGYGY